MQGWKTLGGRNAKDLTNKKIQEEVAEADQGLQVWQPG